MLSLLLFLIYLENNSITHLAVCKYDRCLLVHTINRRRPFKCVYHRVVKTVMMMITIIIIIVMIMTKVDGDYFQTE